MSVIYSVVPSIPSSIFPYIGLIAIVLGILLAFFGGNVFKFLTSVIGAILGAIIGFAIGAGLAGTLGAYIVALIGAIAGGFLFYYVAEAGIALVVAYFTYLGVLFLFGASTGARSLASGISGSIGIAQIAGLIAGFAVFMVSIIFFSDLVAVFTSVAGGFLVDYGLTYFRPGTLATLAAFAVIVLGMIFQFTRIRSRKMAKEKIIREMLVPSDENSELADTSRQ